MIADLTAWYRAVLDDVEQVARMPSGGGYEPDIWEIRPSRSGRWSHVVARSRTLGEPVAAAGEEDDHPVAIVQAGRWEDKHIVLHDPDREVADVAAKRAILDMVDGWQHDTCQDGWYSCSQATEANGFDVDVACADDDRAGQPCDCGLDARKRAIVATLALPHAGRAGYREEWRP